MREDGMLNLNSGDSFSMRADTIVYSIVSQF